MQNETPARSRLVYAAYDFNYIDNLVRVTGTTMALSLIRIWCVCVCVWVGVCVCARASWTGTPGRQQQSVFQILLRPVEDWLFDGHLLDLQGQLEVSGAADGAH